MNESEALPSRHWGTAQAATDPQGQTLWPKGTRGGLLENAASSDTIAPSGIKDATLTLTVSSLLDHQLGVVNGREVEYNWSNFASGAMYYAVYRFRLGRFSCGG